ncbi:MAG: SpoIID/LytB domain-containing protein [Planctomycetota bacterium]
MKAETLRLALACGAIVFLGAFLAYREVPPREVRALAAYPPDARGVPEVRVAFARPPEGVRLSVGGPFDILGGTGPGDMARIGPTNPSLAPILVRGTGGGLAVGVHRLKHPVLEIRPHRGVEVRVDGVPLPGGAAFVREAEGYGVAAVALVDVETYACAGLVASADWRERSDEALAAEAVALRTHALYRRAVAGGSARAWDFEEPGLAEALRAGGHGSARIARAVNATRGLVLTWGQRLFPAFATASCGGMTEDAANVFTAEPVSPLAGRECEHCRDTPPPGAAWTVRLRTSRITERLRPYVEGGGPRKLGNVKRVEAVATGTSGRAIMLCVHAAYGTFEMDVEFFRAAMGGLLPAAPLVVKDAGPEVVEFSGRGEGAGVGLCRWGAERMAREGRSSDDILVHYFPGAEIAALPYRKQRD